jgi:fructoselysine 6-kinase
VKLAAIGSNCIDFYENMGGGKACPGGGPVNMAVYTVRLGGEASYIGPVGNDSYGKIMQESVARMGVDVSHVHVKEGSTAVSSVRLINGERVFGDYDEGVLSEYSLSEEDLRFICRHDVVVCDLWGKVEGYFAQLQRRGVKTAFDCATRPGDAACHTAIPHTDYLFFSTDDGNTETLHELMKVLHNQGPELVTAMLGEEGSLCYDGRTFHQFGVVPCPHVVDSMGAGDSYIAGFLFALAKGLPIEACMEKGAANATRTLQYFGAWEPGV